MSSLRTKLWSTRRRKVATVVASLALLGAGVAVAAWLVNATGTGQGRTASLAAPTIAVGTASGPGCLPGGDCDAAVKITNSNAVPLTITTIADGGTPTQFTGSCLASNLTVNAGAVTGGVTVPANASNAPVVIPNAYHLSATAPSTCQGDTFTKGMTLTFATQ